MINEVRTWILLQECSRHFKDKTLPFSFLVTLFVHLARSRKRLRLIIQDLLSIFPVPANCFARTFAREQKHWERM